MITRFKILEECGDKKEFRHCYIHTEDYKAVNATFVMNKCSRMQYWDNLVVLGCKLRYLNPDITEEELEGELLITMRLAEKSVPSPTVLVSETWKIVDEVISIAPYQLHLCEGFYTWSKTEWKPSINKFVAYNDEDERNILEYSSKDGVKYHQIEQFKSNIKRNKKIAYSAKCRAYTFNGITDAFVNDTIITMVEEGFELTKSNILATINVEKEMSLSTLNTVLKRLNRRDIEIVNSNNKRRLETYLKLNTAGHTIHSREEFITKYKVNKETSVSPKVIRKHWGNLEGTFNELNNRLNNN
tara:strand:- start:311 stop:1210 length:900 start_codon:yes stop_codon:yes gene_type:complete